MEGTVAHSHGQVILVDHIPSTGHTESYQDEEITPARGSSDLLHRMFVSETYDPRIQGENDTERNQEGKSEFVRMISGLEQRLEICRCRSGAGNYQRCVDYVS